MDSKGPGPLAKSYLFLYNAIQTIGWAFLYLQLVNYHISSDSIGNSLFQSVKCPLIIFQLFAVLEIIHAITKIVPSNPKVVALQIFFRIVIVCGILTPSISAQKSMGFSIALFAWSVTEIIRYGYYSLNIVNLVPYFLMWLRYTTFIVLYPLGGVGEFICLYTAQKEIGETGLQSIKLPNFLNLLFRGVIILLMLLIIPGFLKLYTHMFAQRRKVMKQGDGSGASKKKK